MASDGDDDGYRYNDGYRYDDGSPWHDMARHGTARAQHNTARYDMFRLGTTRYVALVVVANMISWASPAPPSSAAAAALDGPPASSEIKSPKHCTTIATNIATQQQRRQASPPTIKR